jgi:hypothetical protein
VRHRRRALLLFAEEFFCLAHFRPLQVADLGRDLVEGAAITASVRDNRVPVALDDLRRYLRRLQPQPLADLHFVLRLQMRERADRAGKFADAHLFGNALEAVDVALQSPSTSSPASAEGDRLGVDAVRAPDHRRVFEFEGAPLQHLAQRLQVFRISSEASFNLQRLRRIHWGRERSFRVTAANTLEGRRRSFRVAALTPAAPAARP